MPEERGVDAELAKIMHVHNTLLLMRRGIAAGTGWDKKVACPPHQRDSPELNLVKLRPLN